MISVGRLFGLFLTLYCCCGCSITPGQSNEVDPFPSQIGAPRLIDTAEMDAYEQTIARLMDHIEDGVLVLSCVEDADSARRAAGMFVEASDRVVMLRRQMLEENPGDKIPPYIIVGYGPRYLFAKVEIDLQLKRIKALDASIHQPLKDVLTRIDDRVEQVEDEFEAEKRGR